MGVITLERRPNLSRRIHAFGGANGRGSNRMFRFGDVSSDRAAVESEIAAMDAGATGPRNHTQLLNTLDWAALYAADPSYIRVAYDRINASSLDPEWAPSIDVWMSRNGKVTQAPVDAPVVVPGTPPVVMPGTTDAEYQAALVQAQIEAAKLQALATSKQAANAADSARIKAEDELARREAADAEAARNAEVTPKPKPNAFPWLIAAGVAFLVLRG
jgi:hypothetical protein